MKQTIAYTWNSTSEERQRIFPCDRYLSEYDDNYFRAVDVQAPISSLFRWLCQLKIAPYSYDWIDNWGNESPRQLTPGVETLAIDQRVMDIFKLVEFEQNRHLTIIMDSPKGAAAFGDIAVSYIIFPKTENTCRLFVKILVHYPRNPMWFWMRWFLPWGDLIMMRKQLLNLKYLAERDANNIPIK
jgi:hypothetical protein